MPIFMAAGGPRCKVLQYLENLRDTELHLVLAKNPASLLDLHLLLVCYMNTFLSLEMGPMPIPSALPLTQLVDGSLKLL